MFSVALIILVSICAVQSDGIYGDVNAVIPEERQYIQDLIDLPKPLDGNMLIQRCGKPLAVTLNFLCPPLRRSPGKGKKWGKILEKGAEIIAPIVAEGIIAGAIAGSKGNTEAPKSSRKKRQLLTDECCDKACTLDTLMQYCPS